MANNKKPAKKSKKSTPPQKTPPVAPPPPVDPADVVLNEDEQAFVDNYLIDRNPTFAYRRIFPACTYRTARRNGAEFRCRTHVAAEIEAALHAQRIRTLITADKVQDEIARIAFSDMYELYDPVTRTLRPLSNIPFNTRKAIASVKVDRERSTRHNHRKRRTTVTDFIVEYKLWNKMDALGKLCSHLGMKTEIPPLDVVLRALPPDLATEVRKALSTPEKVTAPLLNGKH